MKVLDFIALTQDRLDAGLQRGQVGTIVEQLEDGVYEVQLADLEGRSYAMLTLRSDHLMVLHHFPQQNAA